MDFVIAMCLFAVAVLTCLARLHTGIRASGGLCGLLGDGTASRMHGKSAGSCCLEGVRESLLVVRILCIIGVLTAMWRMNRTIAFCTYYGVLAIPAAVVCGMCVCAFGVCVLCHRNEPRRSRYDRHYFNGHCPLRRVNEYMAAGAILSGVYFGDRCSPMGSAANLVASLTQTELYGNVRRMLQTSVLPVAICLAVYGVCSAFSRCRFAERRCWMQLRRSFL